MPVEDAIKLDNMFPETTWVRLRRGSLLYASTGATGPVHSLMTYATVATEKLLAAAGAVIYDVTTATPATVASGFTSDLWQSVNFSTPGGQFLVAVNGTNKQWVYNGTTWTQCTNTLGPSGAAPPDSNTFCCIASFQQRLFFTGVDNNYLYWLPVNVYQGEIHGMDMGAFLPQGGQIAAIGTWTRDNGYGGSDDLLVIVSTHGELIAYLGNNPDSAANWSMVGRFRVGRPVAGHRQLTSLGPDLMYLCEDGFQPLAKYLAVGQSQALAVEISRKIGNAVSVAVQNGGTLAGWEGLLYPRSNWLQINVPQPDNSFQQYVVNTLTGAWCRYLGWNAYCFALYKNNLYYGAANGQVIQAAVGGNDQGNPIKFDMVTSFQLPGQSPMQKRALMCKPYITTDGQVTQYLDVNVDYDIEAVTSPILSGPQATSWDAFNWDAAPWAVSPNVFNAQYSVGAIGNAFAVHLSGQANALTFNVLSFDLAYESGMGFI